MSGAEKPKPVTLKNVGSYTYQSDGPNTPFGTVVSGEFQGWRIGPCTSMLDTKSMVGISLTPEAADKFRSSFMLSNQEFYLDLNAAEFGTGIFCIPDPLKSYTKVTMMKNSLKKSMFDGLPSENIHWKGNTAYEVVMKNLDPTFKTGSDKANDFINSITLWDVGKYFVGALLTLGMVILGGWGFFKGGAIYQKREAKRQAKIKKKALRKANDALKSDDEKGPKGPDDSDPPAQTGGSREHRAPDKPPAAKLVEAAGGKAAAGAGEDTPSEAAAAERSAVQTSLSYDPWERLTKAFFGDAAIVQGARVYSEAKAARARARALTAKVKPAAQAVRVRPKPVRTGGMRGFGVRGVSFRPSFAGAAAGFGNTVFSLGGFFFDGIEYAQARADEGGTSDLDDVFNFFEGMNLGAKCLMWGPGSDSRCSPPSKFPEFDEYHRQRYGPPIDQYFVPRSPMI